MDTGEIKKEVKERTLGYIVAALGLVAGLGVISCCFPGIMVLLCRKGGLG